MREGREPPSNLPVGVPVEMAEHGSAPNHQFFSNGDWSDQLFDCGNDPNSFCLALWCPCIQFGLNVEKASIGSMWKFCLLAFLPEAFNYLLQIYYFVSHPNHETRAIRGNPADQKGIPQILRALQMVSSILVLWLLLGVRQRLKRMYGIQEPECVSILQVWLCGTCTISQEARQIKRVLGELSWPAGVGPSSVEPTMIGYPMGASNASPNFVMGHPAQQEMTGMRPSWHVSPLARDRERYIRLGQILAARESGWIAHGPRHAGMTREDDDIIEAQVVMQGMPPPREDSASAAAAPVVVQGMPPPSEDVSASPAATASGPATATTRREQPDASTGKVT